MAIGGNFRDIESDLGPVEPGWNGKALVTFGDTKVVGDT